MTTTSQTLKGFRDFLPETMSVRNEVVKRLRAVFESFGFEELQTPALEYRDVLTGKYGEEAEKLMYLFKDSGGREVGLRYDLTVPLARVAALYPNLPLPFKRYQMQPVWRAENTQKGRYREFWQCDVDTVGAAPPLADAEILAITDSALSGLGFNSFRIRINSRSVLLAAMEKSGVPADRRLAAIQSIDKLDKKPREAVEEELVGKGFSSDQIQNMFREIEKAKPDDFLARTMELAGKMGVGNHLEFDATLSRGLDYYTGPIFESVVEQPKIGSLSGGGRYDRLLSDLGGPDLPATGTTIGLDRVVDVIGELKMWPDLDKTNTTILVTVFSPESLDEAITWSQKLRGKGVNAELYPDPEVRLDKQLKYADKKGIKFALILGPDEKAKGKVTVKRMATGEQLQLTLDEVAELAQKAKG